MLCCLYHKHGIIVSSLKCLKSACFSFKGNRDFVPTFKKWNSVKCSLYRNTTRSPFAGVQKLVILSSPHWQLLTQGYRSL